MELGWQIRTEMTRDGICYLESDLFAYQCFICEESLDGREIFEEIAALQGLTHDEQEWIDGDVMDLIEEARADLTEQYGDVLAKTFGLCDCCRDWYFAKWRTADNVWLRDQFGNLNGRTKRRPEYDDVNNFFANDEDHFRADIRPKLIVCRLAYPGERPSIDRFWPAGWQDLQGKAKPPYADRFVRVIPQRINSGLASRRVTHFELQQMRELRERNPRALLKEIAAITGRATSTVSRALRGQFMLTIDGVC